jgi:hypothetical protein
MKGNLYQHIKIRHAYDFSLCFPHELLMSFWIFYITKWQSIYIIQNLQSIYYTLLYLKLVGAFIEIKSWMKIKEKS